MKASRNSTQLAGPSNQLDSSTDRPEIIVEQPPAAKQLRYGFWVLAALCGVAFFFGLGRLALVGPDEPRYAEVAREMFASGDYISPRLCGCLWFEKPVLLYWLAAAAYHAFGVSEFAARLPSALAAAATVLLAYKVIRDTCSRLLAFNVAVVLATSAIFIGYARATTTDMVLAASMAAALLSAYAYWASSGREKLIYLALAGAATGLAVLAKGLVGVALVAAIVAIYLLATRRLRAVSLRHFAIAAVVCVAVIAVWYLPVTARHGWEFIDEFILNHHFRRYVSNKYNHPQPVYFYPFVMLAGVMPWTFFLLPALARLRALRPRDDNRDALLLLAWIWTAVPLVFFSFSVSKLPGYILPIFPAVAVIIGSEVERVWRGERSALLNVAKWGTCFMLALIAVAFIVYLEREAIRLEGVGLFFYALPALAAAAAIAALAMSRTRSFIACAVALVASVIIGAVVILFPKLNDELSLKSLSLQAAAQLQPQERIAFYIKKEYAPVFYAEGRVVCDVGGGDVLNALNPDLLVAALQSYPSLIVITTSRWQTDLQSDKRFSTELIGVQDDAAALRIKLREPQPSF